MQKKNPTMATPDGFYPAKGSDHIWLNPDTGEAWSAYLHGPVGRKHKDGRVKIKAGRRDTYLHILMLETFVGPRPTGMEGCHRDDRPDNNQLRNLYWGTHRENMADRARNGHGWMGARNPKTKLQASDVYRIRTMGHTGFLSDLVIAMLLGTSARIVGRILRHETWRHIG